MNRKIAVIAFGLLVGVVAAAMATGAGAAPPPVCDPEDTECGGGGGGGGPVTRNAKLTVVAPSPGTINSTPAEISCGTDCTHTWTYTLECSTETDCTYDDVTQVTLSVSGGPAGYIADWTVCNANADGSACSSINPDTRDCDTESSSQCTMDMKGNYRVSLTWIDTQNPTVSLIAPAAKAGPNTSFAASAGDNAGVARVEFYVDAVLRGTDHFAPYTFSPNLGSYAHDSQHSLTVRSFDVNGRSSALSPSHSFAVDRATAVAIDSPAAGGHFNSAPEFTFTKDADATAKCETVSGLTGGTVLHIDAGCADSYTPQADGPGDYRVRITATDDVGNVATVERSFTIDPAADPGPVDPGPGDPGDPADPAEPAPTGRTIARRLTIVFRKGKVHGLVKPSGGCARREIVKLFKVRAGKDPVVGKDTTDRSGLYVIRKRGGAGRFYTRVMPSGNGLDTCAPARSKTLIFANAA